MNFPIFFCADCEHCALHFPSSPAGTVVQRLDEIGYFAFGGSTIICIFEKGAIEFDADLLENSRKHLETLIKVGNSIGRATAHS